MPRFIFCAFWRNLPGTGKIACRSNCCHSRIMKVARRGKIARVPHFCFYWKYAHFPMSFSTHSYKRVVILADVRGPPTDALRLSTLNVPVCHLHCFLWEYPAKSFAHFQIGIQLFLFLVEGISNIISKLTTHQKT